MSLAPTKRFCVALPLFSFCSLPYFAFFVGAHVTRAVVEASYCALPNMDIRTRAIEKNLNTIVILLLLLF